VEFLKLITLLKDVSRPLRLKYYHWKSWHQLFNSIKKEGVKNTLNNQKIKYINKPGIVLSFDDSFRVDGWNKAKDLFGYYDVKVTFNVNAIHHFEGQREHTQEEIDKLIELQSYGHEIAHHTLKHNNAVNFIKKYGIDKWLNEEIVPLFNWLELQKHSITKEQFKKTVSFAFPHFATNQDLINALFPKYFKVVRGGKKNILAPFNVNGFIPSIDIDENVISNPKYIKKIIKYVKRSGKNIIFTCHSILNAEFNWNDYGYGEESKKSGEYRISPERLNFIIKEARKHDLEFYTTAEVAGVATFIDRNFESQIRNLLSIPKDQWIKISDLMTIKELDLSNKGIKNLDGLQYFLNLEKLNISNNPIIDTRLIDKLPRLKVLVTNSDSGVKSLMISNVN
jgi:hypothetical protein